MSPRSLAIVALAVGVVTGCYNGSALSNVDAGHDAQSPGPDYCTDCGDRPFPDPDPLPDPSDPDYEAPRNPLCSSGRVAVGIAPLSDVEAPSIVQTVNGNRWTLVAWISNDPVQERVRYTVVDEAGEVVVPPRYVHEAWDESISFSAAWNGARNVFEVFVTVRTKDRAIDTIRVRVDPVIPDERNQEVIPIPGVVDAVAISDTGRTAIVYNESSVVVESVDGSMSPAFFESGEGPVHVVSAYDRLYFSRGNELVVWSDARGYWDPTPLPLGEDQEFYGLVRLGPGPAMVWFDGARYGVTSLSYNGLPPSASFDLGALPPRSVGAEGSRVWWLNDDGLFSVEGTESARHLILTQAPAIRPTARPVTTLTFWGDTATFFDVQPLQMFRVQATGEVQITPAVEPSDVAGRHLVPAPGFKPIWDTRLAAYRYFAQQDDRVVEYRLDAGGQIVGAKRWLVHGSPGEPGCFASNIPFDGLPRCVTVQLPEECSLDVPATATTYEVPNGQTPTPLATIEVDAYESPDGCAYPVFEQVNIYDDYFVAIARHETAQGPRWFHAVHSDSSFPQSRLFSESQPAYESFPDGTFAVGEVDGKGQYVTQLRQGSFAEPRYIEPGAVVWAEQYGVYGAYEREDGLHYVSNFWPYIGKIAEFVGERPEQLFVVGRQVYGVTDAGLSQIVNSTFSRELRWYGAERITVRDIVPHEIAPIIYIAFDATSHRGITRQLIASVGCGG